jgi:nucleoside phosphorylase
VTAPPHSRAPVAIVIALREEERALERIIERGATRGEDLRPARGTISGHPVVLARTGIGRELARAGVTSLIATELPRALLVTGYGGALRPGLEPGDVLVAGEVIDARMGGDGGIGATASRLIADASLLEAASRVRIPSARVITGRLATVDRVLTCPAEKKEAGEALGADACDMESSGALQAAAEMGIPALAARAIVDEWDLDIPFDLGKLMSPRGTVRPLKVLRALATHPLGVLRLAALRSRAGKASASLAAFARAFVALVVEPPA